MGKWLALHGDQCCTFVSLVSLGVKALNVATIPPWVLNAGLIFGIIATAAHQSFFPSPTTGVKIQ